MKEGYKTTEFWITAGASLIALLVAVGVLDPTSAELLGDNWAVIVDNVFGLIAAVALIVNYAKERTALKAAEMG